MTTLRSLFAALMLLAAGTASLHAQAAAAPPAKVDSLEGQASFGLALTSGNSNASTVDISDKLKYTKRGWGFGQDLKYFYGEADDKVTADFWSVGVRVERRLMPRLGMFFLTRWDRNRLQGIASRFEESIGFDFTAVDAPKDKLIFTAGASAFQQELTPGSTSTFKGNYPAARLAGDYKHKFTDKAYFQQTVEYLPNLKDSEAYLINGESTVVAPLWSSFGLKISNVVRYNNAPPTRDGVRLKTTDRFFSSALTYSF